MVEKDGTGDDFRHLLQGRVFNCGAGGGLHTMTYTTNPSAVMRGWLEVLFCLQPTPLCSIAELDMDNYFPLAGKLGLKDFYGPYGVYESQFELDLSTEPPEPLLDASGKFIPLMQAGKPMLKYGFPRRLDCYDIINLVARKDGHEEVSVVSMMVINEAEHMHLIQEFPQAKIQARAGAPLSGLILNTPFYKK